MRDRSIFLARSGTGSSKWFVKRKETDDVKTSLKEIICIMISPQEWESKRWWWWYTAEV